MARAKKAAGMKKKAAGKKVYRKRRMVRQRGDIARLTQILSSASGTGAANPPTFNKIYKMSDFSLGNCDRAVAVAKAYQQFRIKYVEMKFKAKQDTYIGAGAGVWQGSIPYLYWYYDPVGSISENNASSPPLNFNMLRDAGCKPRRFDDKDITIRFKPAIVDATLDKVAGINTTGYTKAIKSPWMNTNAASLLTGGWSPNLSEHYGLVFGVEQENPGDGSQLRLYDYDIIYHFEFKKPRVFSTTGAPNDTIVVDQSPTGGFIEQ